MLGLKLNCVSKRGHWGSFLFISYPIFMTSSNGNIFHVTGPLRGEFTGHRWIARTKASDTELWRFLWSVSGQTVEYKQERRRWFETLSRSLWRHTNDIGVQHRYDKSFALQCLHAEMTSGAGNPNRVPVQYFHGGWGQLHNGFMRLQFKCIKNFLPSKSYSNDLIRSQLCTWHDI